MVSFSDDFCSLQFSRKIRRAFSQKAVEERLEAAVALAEGYACVTSGNEELENEELQKENKTESDRLTDSLSTEAAVSGL